MKIYMVSLFHRATIINQFLVYVLDVWFWLQEGGYIAVVCEVVCYTEARPGLSGKKMRWYFSEQR